MLKEILASRPGSATVVLSTPEGDLTVARDCGLKASQAPEMSLLLGLDAEITVSLATAGV